MLIPELDTPFVTIDLGRVERNIARMQDYCSDHGLRLRPHVKTHKIPSIAYLQIQAGAVGIACQKLGEAEVMADAGISDIMLCYPIIGGTKAWRLAALADRVHITSIVDSEPGARGIAQAAKAQGTEIDVMVDCDTGFRRTGVQTPRAAASLARLVHCLPGLRFAGLLTYPTLPGTAEWLRAARRECELGRLPVECVSSGGTPDWFKTHELADVVTELRIGTYIYGDRACIADGSAVLDECAMRVRTTIVSRPTSDRAIIDAGSKTLTTDRLVEGAGTGYGLILEHPEADIYDLSEEHGHVDLSRCLVRPEIGDVVTLVPNHACGATNLHDEVALYRGDEVVEIAKVSARGRVR